MSLDEVDRDVDSIVLPAWGQVVACDTAVPWLVIGPGGEVLEPIHRYLLDFVAQGNSAGSVRSYAYALLRWWRFLRAVEVVWDKATSVEARDFVLWLQRASKPRRLSRTVSAATAGTINPITRKQYLDDRYQVRTVRHSNAVVRSFYGFWIEQGAGPLVNPIPQQRRKQQRGSAHHNPLEPFRPAGRLRYNPRLPKRAPRAMPDERWSELFAAMRSNRDRAILAMAISNAARAAELLGIRGADLDWGDQLVRVRRKGSGAQQWLPTSPEAFVWLRLYLDDIGGIEANDPVWWTLRRRDHGSDGMARRRPLTYDAWRAVLRRANTALGTNWTMHDARHTCALRMLRDESLSLRDVQTILGHAHLTTTQVYLEQDDQEVIGRVRQHHAYLAQLARRDDPPNSAPALPVAGYAAADLAVLFGARQ